MNVIGRSSSHCDIFIDKASISLKHCIIIISDNVIHLRDLGSTNGTWVNHNKIKSTDLKIGDRINFGKIAFTLASTIDISTTGETQLTSKLSSIENLVISNQLESGLVNDDFKISDTTKTSLEEEPLKNKKAKNSNAPVINNYFITNPNSDPGNKVEKKEVKQYDSQETNAFITALDTFTEEETKTKPEVLKRIKHDENNLESGYFRKDHEHKFSWFLYIKSQLKTPKTIALIIMLLVLIIINLWIFFSK